MDAEIDLRSIFSFLKRQLRLILVVFIAVVGIAAAVVFTMTPIYTATTLVMVDPSDKNLLLPQNQLGPVTAVDARIEGEVLLAQSDNVLLTVIDRENLVNSNEFRPELGFTARILSFLRLREPTLPTPDQALRQTLSKLESMVSVQRHRATFLISISAGSQDPERAALLANAVARAYIDTQLTAKVQSTIDARDVLLQQVNAARQSVIETDGSFDRFIETNLGSIVEQTGNTDLANIQAEIGRLTASRQSRTVEVAALQTQLAQQDFSALATRLADDAIVNLERQRQDILGQLQQGGTSVSDVDLRQQLARIEDDLQSQAAGAISGLQAQVQQEQSQETTLRQNLRSAILAGGLSPDTLTEIYDLQQQAELARQQYDQLLARSPQLQAEATLQLADSRVVSPALRPSNPSFPNTRNMLALAALIGLALGIGLAFLYEHFIGGITTDEQLASIAKTRMALTVPRAKLGANQNSVSEFLVTAPLSAFSESVRRIRTNIDQSLALSNEQDTGKAPVIMVTSTAPAEGKTTIALSVARSYALAGRNTLLIDCDLRRPSLHRQLGVEPAEGLIDALTSDNPGEKLKVAMTTDETTGLLTLVGSRRSNLATDQLVTSRSFDRLIAAASQAFDVIILDTPPLGPVVDGIYIARKADAVVFVVHWASTSQQDLRKALLSLEPALDEDTILVPVLNQQNASTTPYYRRYSDYYTETA